MELNYCDTVLFKSFVIGHHSPYLKDLNNFSIANFLFKRNMKQDRREVELEKKIVEELKKMNRILGGISTRIGRLKYDQPIPVFSKDGKGKTIFLFESQEGIDGIREWFETDKCKSYKPTAYVVWDGVEIKLFDDLGKGAFE